MRSLAILVTVAVLALSALMLSVFPASAHAPSGAIFTTTDDGSRVNANIYPSKLDVYLDGGPGPNAPQTAAGLDDGIYVFQVTDPSGQTLLSTDKAKCRVVEVAQGVIQKVLDWDGAGITSLDFTGHTFAGGPGGQPGPKDACHDEGKSKGKHDANQDTDHSPPAIVVQLMPYADTPNPGGVYKAWMTRIEDYLLGCAELGFTGDSGLNQVDCGYAPGNFHGFIPAHSKTDNYKVRDKVRRKGPPQLTVHKFCDVNCNGVQDAANGAGLEPCLSDVQINVTDSLGATVCSGLTVGGFFSCALPGTGTYTVSEILGTGLAVCGASVDGAPQGRTTSVAVTAATEDASVVVEFGNTPTDGIITANKLCAVSNESPINGVQFNLAGTDVLGNTISRSTTTAGGVGATFSGLAAGSYTLTEIVPQGFAAIGPTTCTVNLTVDTSLDHLTGEAQCTVFPAQCTFKNVALGDVGARTPGFWCSQVQREAGLNPSLEAACYEHLVSSFGTIQAVVNAAFSLWQTEGGAPSLYDLVNSGGVSNAEAQEILCPQADGAEHEQCRRQSFALLMNLAGFLNEPNVACPVIGTTQGQLVVIGGELKTVGQVVDMLVAGCTPEVHTLIKGINEGTITVLPTCPASVP
jgi:hypothetical protein